MSFDHTQLGRGSRGHQPLIIGHTLNGGERSSNRSHLRRAFGNMYNNGLGNSPALYNNGRNILGPFKTSFNAGDIITNNIRNTNVIYGRISNQVGGNNLTRLQVNGDGNSQQNGTAMYSGNTRYVHDGSDYIRFKKLNAINKNYNDSTFGGDSNVNAQHAIRRIRR